MLGVPDPSSYIDTRADIFERLVVQLRRNDSWKVIAANVPFLKKLNLEDESCPSSKILKELRVKECKYGELRQLLYKWNLNDVAAVISEPSPLIIKRQPGEEDSNMFVPYGGELCLEIEATGVPPPQYLWHVGNKELPDQQSSCLLITNFQPENEGEYRCCVSQDSQDDTEDDIQEFSNTVNVHMLPECPRILEQPQPLALRVGNEIKLSCKAISYPPPKYEWMKGNLILDSQRSCVLKVAQAALTDAGEYKCCITNGFDEIFTDGAKVSVYEIPIEETTCETRLKIVEEKVALLIVNANYRNLSELMTPYNDAKALHDVLTRLGFKVLTLCDLSLIEMENAIKTFSNLLPVGAYAIVYFAGHGFELHDKYMLPTDCPDMFCCESSLSERYVIKKVMERKPQLLLLILDMCLRHPNSSRGNNPTPISFEPQRNLIQAYATTSNLCAYERKTESNGIYIKHLLNYLANDLPVERILQMVNRSIAQEAADAVHLQIPSFTNNVVPDIHYLTVPLRGNRETESQFVQLANLQPKLQVYFRKIDHFATLELYFHMKCFLNAIEIHFYDLHKWKIECELQNSDLELILKRHENVKILTVLCLQKLKTPSLSISISLYGPERKLIDNGLFEVNIPITSADLWFSSRSVEDRTEE